MFDAKFLSDIVHNMTVEYLRDAQRKQPFLPFSIHMADGKFAISGLRVFGTGHGDKPSTVKQFIVLRTEKDKRSAWLKWSPSQDAYAYNIYMGTDPGKLYNCIMVYGSNEYWLKSLDKNMPFYFCIEALNENGISQLSPVVKVE